MKHWEQELNQAEERQLLIIEQVLTSIGAAASLVAYTGKYLGAQATQNTALVSATGVASVEVAALAALAVLMTPRAQFVGKAQFISVMPKVAATGA